MCDSHPSKNHSVKIRIAVHNCARCGQFHSEVDFYEFQQNAVEFAGYDGDEVFSHFGFCPVLHEPILMKTMVEGQEKRYAKTNCSFIIESITELTTIG